MSTKDLFEKYVEEVCSQCTNRCKEYTLCNITIQESNKIRDAKCDYFNREGKE